MLFHAGVVIVPPSALTPHGTCECAMNFAVGASTSPANDAGNFPVQKQIAVNWRRIGGTGAPGGGFAMREFTDSPVSGAKAVM